MRSSNPWPSSALLDLPIVGAGVVNTHKFTNLPAGCFATWVPKLFTHYLEHVTPLSEGQRVEEEKVMRRRWSMGLSLFSTLDKLKSMHKSQPQ
jgi:hypothetical protein